MKYEKHDIVFMMAHFTDISHQSDILKLLRNNYKAINYPFGLVNKVKYSAPIYDGKDGYYMTASVYMDDIKYMKKCAQSDSERLHEVCLAYVKQYHPNLVDSFLDLKQMYTRQKAIMMAKRKVEVK